MGSRGWALPAPFHWWQQGSARAQCDSPAAREGREGVRVQGWARKRWHSWGDSGAGTCGCALTVKAALVLLSGRTLWAGEAEMVSLGKGCILMLIISLVHLSIWSTGTCGDTAEGMVGLRLRRRRGNYLEKLVWQPRSSVILLLPILFLQTQLILLGNRKQSLTGSKRAVLETIFAVKEGQPHVPG